MFRLESIFWAFQIFFSLFYNGVYGKPGFYKHPSSKFYQDIDVDIEKSSRNLLF